MFPVVKIAVLGKSGVGKTSFIRRFKHHVFIENDDATNEDKSSGCHNNESTKSRCESTACMTYVCHKKDDNVREEMTDVIFKDFRCINSFPVDSLEEWDADAIGLRSADAYILMFDLNDATSFDYVSRIRQEILNSFSTNLSKLKSSHGKLTARSSSNLQNKISALDDQNNSSRCLNRNSSLGLSISESHVVTGRNSALSCAMPFALPYRLSNAITKRGQQPPAVVIVGNKKDLELAQTQQYGDYYGDMTSRRMTLDKGTPQLTKKRRKWNFLECSVKCDWNVSLVVMETISASKFRRNGNNLKDLF